MLKTGLIRDLQPQVSQELVQIDSGYTILKMHTLCANTILQVLDFQIKLAIFQQLTKVGCHLLTYLKAVSKENDDILDDTPTSSPSQQAEIVMSWVGHFSVVKPNVIFIERDISCYTT